MTETAHSADYVWMIYVSSGGYDEVVDSVWATEDAARSHAAELETNGFDIEVVPYEVRRIDGEAGS